LSVEELQSGVEAIEYRFIFANEARKEKSASRRKRSALRLGSPVPAALAQARQAYSGLRS
jgi:hypothetical protein